MATKTLWIGPEEWVTGEESLQLTHPSETRAATEVRARTPGSPAWVFLALDVPACAAITAVRICYRLSDPRSFISRIQLTELTAPEGAVVQHDDATSLISTDPACYVSAVPFYRPRGAAVLQLRLQFATNTDRIELGAVGVDLRSYGTTGPVCDVRFSLQGRYSSIDLGRLGVSNDAVTVNGSALLASRNTTVADFLASTETEIGTSFETYLSAHGIPRDTDHLIVLDLEPGETSVSPPGRRSFAPRALGEWEGDPRQLAIIDAYARRIRVARSVLPRARLALYQVVAAEGRGRETPKFLDQMKGLFRAAERGMFDSLDLLSPVVYARFGPADVRAGRPIDTVYGWVEASTRQGVEQAQRLGRSDGSPIALAPYLTFWSTRRGRAVQPAVPADLLGRQLRILQEYCGVAAIVLWSGSETPEEMLASGREVIDFATVLAATGALPPSGCSPSFSP